MKDYEGREIKGKGILAHLGASPGARIFYLMKESGGFFRITEACDDYFSVGLTQAELRTLGEELIAIAEGRADPP